MSEAASIARALHGRRSGSRYLCRCPAHEDRDPSLSIWDGDDAIVVKCFAGCPSVEVLAALRRLGLLDDRRQRDRPLLKPPTPRPAPSEPPTGLRWSGRALAIWRRTVPIAGTVVDVYLRSRGCVRPSGDDVQYLPATERHPWPAMVSRVTDLVTGEPLTLHLTFLQLDGSDKAPVEKPKRLLAGHTKRGGVIRLCPDAEVTMALGLSEGVETALAVVAAGWGPVWSAIDAGNLASLPVVSGIEALTIYADHDEAGLRAGHELAGRWRAAGREARVVPPPLAGTDWADRPEAA